MYSLYEAGVRNDSYDIHRRTVKKVTAACPVTFDGNVFVGVDPYSSSRSPAPGFTTLKPNRGVPLQKGIVMDFPISDKCMIAWIQAQSPVHKTWLLALSHGKISSRIFHDIS